MDHFLKNVGKKIGEVRRKNGHTQLQLAERVGVSIHLVQYWESGRNLTLKTLYSISKHLKHPVAAFFEEPMLDGNYGRPKTRYYGKPPNIHRRNRKKI